MMSWYLAKTVFQIVCGDGNHTPQFDEQLRLIKANNKIEAVEKAQQVGRQEEETFYNQRQQLVQWLFVNVCEVYRLSDLIDGAELYSRIEERDNAEAYIAIVHEKAKNIVSPSTQDLFELA